MQIIKLFWFEALNRLEANLQYNAIASTINMEGRTQGLRIYGGEKLVDLEIAADIKQVIFGHPAIKV
jgi:hypothetical protein